MTRFIHFFGWRLKNRGVKKFLGGKKCGDLWGGSYTRHVSDATHIVFCSLDRLERNNIKHDASRERLNLHTSLSVKASNWRLGVLPKGSTRIWAFTLLSNVMEIQHLSRKQEVKFSVFGGSLVAGHQDM